MKLNRYIISGGGTGGHIFPAVSIAQEILKRNPSADILFVGAQGRMEMEKIPALGYKIVGLPIAGIQRKFDLKNLLLPFKIISSLVKAASVVRSHKPVAVIGVGGYASFPVLFTAGLMGYPIVLQEQNSYAGVTNKVLSRFAHRICVAYDGMSRFFQPGKIILTGNPIRSGLDSIYHLKDEAKSFFQLKGDRPVVLITGGSLGARTINRAFIEGILKLKDQDIDVLWQTGKLYYTDVLSKVEASGATNLHVFDFIYKMDLAYSCADVIVSRAGAGTISELCVVGKAVILIPSPNVAEDHQTQNALALVRKNAAIMIKDTEAPTSLVNETLRLLKDTAQQAELAKNIRALALPNAAATIVDEIENLIKQRYANV